MHWSWKEGLKFALAEKLVLREGRSYEMQGIERVGSTVLRPFHHVVRFLSKHIRLPLVICLLTILVSLVVGWAFYEIDILILLEKALPISKVYFLLFIYVELNLLAMGCVAFGRFNNRGLIDLWKQGQLFPIMPGDYKI